jgi:hypothetical protein
MAGPGNGADINQAFHPMLLEQGDKFVDWPGRMPDRENYRRCAAAGPAFPDFRLAR